MSAKDAASPIPRRPSSPRASCWVRPTASERPSKPEPSRSPNAPGLLRGLVGAIKIDGNRLIPIFRIPTGSDNGAGRNIDRPSCSHNASPCGGEETRTCDRALPRGLHTFNSLPVRHRVASWHSLRRFNTHDGIRSARAAQTRVMTSTADPHSSVPRTNDGQMIKGPPLDLEERALDLALLCSGARI
jgi:hypothetical protein